MFFATMFETTNKIKKVRIKVLYKGYCGQVVFVVILQPAFCNRGFLYFFTDKKSVPIFLVDQKHCPFIFFFNSFNLISFIHGYLKLKMLELTTNHFY